MTGRPKRFRVEAIPVIPDPRKRKADPKEGEARKPWEPVEPGEPSHLPEEPENVRSPERPAPKKKPPTNWGGHGGG